MDKENSMKKGLKDGKFVRVKGGRKEGKGEEREKSISN